MRFADSASAFDRALRQLHNQNPPEQ